MTDIHQKWGATNYVKFFRHPHEIEVLGVDAQKRKRERKLEKQDRVCQFFCIIFEVRHAPPLVNGFKAAAHALKECHGGDLINYGGNIRGHGADLRYSGKSGITGNLPNH